MPTHRDFFLSYSSFDKKEKSDEKEKDDDIYRFFKDLVQELRFLGRVEGGFFADRRIETGADWTADLLHYLKSCHVIVPLYSPNYFKSPHCGREWKVFYDRFQENKTPGAPRDVLKPEIILPVLWTAELLDVPPEVTQFQKANIADYPEVYQRYGLSYMMRSSGASAKAKYKEFLRQFALRLRDMLNAQGAPKVRPIPEEEYRKIDPLFPPDSKRGLTFVRYVFMAGLRDEMKTRRPGWNRYGIYSDRQDWCPCYPEVDREAGDIAGQFASAAGKTFEFIELGEKLLDRLKYAKELENIVVIVVDPWSVDLPSLKELKAGIDREALPNSGLFIMQNHSGAETGGVPVLKVPGEPRFDSRQSRDEYVITVRSHEELQQKLETFFNTLREAMTTGGRIRSAEENAGAPQPLLKG
jgi:hypothetical protein